jgi:hypothetical protein
MWQFSGVLLALQSIIAPLYCIVLGSLQHTKLVQVGATAVQERVDGPRFARWRNLLTRFSCAQGWGCFRLVCRVQGQLLFFSSHIKSDLFATSVLLLRPDSAARSSLKPMR